MITANATKKSKNHKVALITLSLVIVVTITIFVLFLAMPNESSSNKSSSDKTNNIAEATSKKFQYEYIETKYIGDKKIPKFIYYTSETTDSNIIAMNDQIIANLKKAKKISSKTKMYSIDYFNNRESAKNYYESIGNKSLTAANRLKLISSYVATMSYSKQGKISQLFRISSAKILKKY